MNITDILIERNKFPSLLRRTFASWLTAVMAEYLLLSHESRSLDDLAGLAGMSFIRVLALTAAVFVLLFAVSLRRDTKNLECFLMAATFTVTAAISLFYSFSWIFLTICILIFGIIILYAVTGRETSPVTVAPAPREHQAHISVTVILAVLFVLFVSLWGVCRVYSFCTPTYDLGIFSQMFHSMKTTGLPTTTLERDGPLSHFNVHMSPAYYIILPLYCLYPRPETLAVLQAAVLASSVIPLWLICGLHGLTGTKRTLLCAVLLLYPALAGGTGYDIHENCFLAPFVLWLLYGIDQKSPAIIAISAVLTLTVKEDAAVYVAVAALYLIVKTLLDYDKSRRRELITGILLLAFSVIWFFCAVGYLQKYGDGVFTSRTFGNFLYDGSESIFTVIKSIIICPFKAIYECSDENKLYFIQMTLIPLLGLPLITRRFERYILLIPYVLINLMPDYQYQYDIFFQYVFGSTACLLYLTAVNLADIKFDRVKLTASGAAAVVAAVCFCSSVVPIAWSYVERCDKYSGYYDNLRQTLDIIPDDASVTATTFYTTYLSCRETIYDVRYSSKEHLLSTEYVVLNVTADREYSKYGYGGKNGYDNLVRILETNGYEPVAEIEGTMVIYHRAANSDD